MQYSFWEAEGPKFTDAVKALEENSAAIRQEIEIEGHVVLSKSYVATDWSKDTKADHRALMGGFDEKNGTCDRCFQIRSASGACGC